MLNKTKLTYASFSCFNLMFQQHVCIYTANPQQSNTVKSTTHVLNTIYINQEAGLLSFIIIRFIRTHLRCCLGGEKGRVLIMRSWLCFEKNNKCCLGAVCYCECVYAFYVCSSVCCKFIIWF